MHRYVLSCPDVSNNRYISLSNSWNTALYLGTYEDRALSDVTMCTKSSNTTLTSKNPFVMTSVLFELLELCPMES
jgi:hypothetical protein